MPDIPSDAQTVRRPSLAILVAMAAIGPLALNIFMPSMPGMVRVFETTPAMVQLTLSLFLVAIAVAQLIIGPLSDHYGRRPVLLAGMILFVIASLACRLSPTIEALIAARILQGASGCFGLVLSRSIVRDLYQREKSASMIGYVTMGMAVAPMIGPAIGGYLDIVAGWQTPFDLMIVLGLIVLIACYFTLGETNTNPTPSFGLTESLKSYRKLLSSPNFLGFSATSALATCVFFAFLGGAPFIVTEIMGLTPVDYGLYFALVAGGYLVGNFLSGRFAERLGVIAMITTGNVLSLAAIGVMGLGFALGILHPLMLFGPVFFTSMANGMILPNAIAGAVSIRPDLAGAASGLSGSLQMGAGAAASAVVGALLTTSKFAGTQWPLILVMGVASIAAFTAGLVCIVLERRAEAV